MRLLLFQQLVRQEFRDYLLSLLFLENAGILDSECREMIVERALALGETEIELENLKVIVLMVLWQQDRPINGLILDELLNESEEDEEEQVPFAVH